MSAEEIEVLSERANSFLRNARSPFEEGDYDLSAFNVQQFSQLTLKHKLLAKTGTYPRAHSLVRLMRDLDAASAGKGLLSFIDSEILLLTKVDDAYIVSRYIPRRYEKAEAQLLLNFAERLKGAVERV